MLLDTYTRRARLQPILIVTLPLGLATLAWFPNGLSGWSLAWSLVTWSGATALMSQIGRDMGKKKENNLFKLWGGKPTTQLLRHIDAPNKVTLIRQHKKLEELIPGLKMPTSREEEADKDSADQVYDSCVAFLVENTRDLGRFPLIFDELCSYGFRRNLWGLKQIGITTATIGLIAVVVLIILNGFLWHVQTPFLSIVLGVGNSFLLVGWFVWFTPKWVRIPAEAYARSLLAACEVL